jgi:hypothetical protein
MPDLSGTEPIKPPKSGKPVQQRRRDQTEKRVAEYRSVFKQGLGTEWVDDYLRQLFKFTDLNDDELRESREPDLTDLEIDETDITAIDPELVKLFMTAPGKHHLVVSLSCSFSQHFITRALAYDFLRSSGEIHVLGNKSSFTHSEIFEKKQVFNFEDPADYLLNPFIVVNNLDSFTLDLLTPLFGEMIFPERELSPSQGDALQRHLIKIYNQYGNKSMLPHLFSSLRSASGKEEKVMGERLQTFFKQNRREAFFDTDPYHYPPQPLTIFEFQHFNQDQPMAAVALLCTLFQIIQPRWNKKVNQRSIILLDGTHPLLKKGSGMRFLELTGQAFQQSGGALVTSVSGFKKFISSGPGEVFSQLRPLSCAGQKISNKRVTPIKDSGL